ncbi:hypothetical protein Agub_g14604, partial [Astrephomene gubernaculifera]
PELAIWSVLTLTLFTGIGGARSLTRSFELSERAFAGSKAYSHIVITLFPLNYKFVPMAEGSSSSPWLYKAAAITAAATLTAGAGYVIYKYVLASEPEQEAEEAPMSMQALLTGGATGSASQGPSIAIRKTPSPPKQRAGPSLPTRKPAPKPPSTTITVIEDGPSDSGASTSAASSAAASKPAGTGLKSCACCSKPLKSGMLPLRCGNCKSVYYCSISCQKKHWPEHKPSCTKVASPRPDAPAAGGSGPSGDSGAAGPSGGSPAEKSYKAAVTGEEAAPAPTSSEAPAASPAEGSSTSSTSPSGDAAAPADSAAPEAPAATEVAEKAAEQPKEEDAVPAAEPVEGAGEEKAAEAKEDAAAAAAPAEGAAAAAAAEEGSSSSGAPGAAHGGLQGALVEVLRQAAERGAGTLDGRFEEAVMYFLGGKLPTALAAFQALQTAARQQSRSDLVMELHKWLGHTHTKLGNFTAAADSFRAGIEAAQAEDNAAAQVDNAVGLGNLWKSVGKLSEATEVLKEALIVAQKADSAGMQSEVLVALGNAVMSAEPEEGLTCLQIAVKLREDEVAKAAETGDRAAMATGMMQAAAAMVNMAAALFATHRFQQAKQAYEQAMEIFELMEDHDKVIQVLINLANLAELQLDMPQEALRYRQALATALEEAGHSGIAGGAETAPCGVCNQPIHITQARTRGDADSAAKGPMVILGCLHVQHDNCFKEYCDRARESVAAAAAGLAAATQGGEEAAAVAAAAASPGVKRTTTCPTCKAPVPVMT